MSLRYQNTVEHNALLKQLDVGTCRIADIEDVYNKSYAPNTLLSYSTYSAYKQCPRKLAIRRIIGKAANEVTIHTIAGHNKHTKLEEAVKAFPTRIQLNDPSLVNVMKWLVPILNDSSEYVPEKKLEDSEFIGYVDLLAIDKTEEHATLIDYKNGNPKYVSKEQLGWYAAMVFNEYPKLKTVRAVFFFLKDSSTKSYLITRERAEQVYEEMLIASDDYRNDKEMKAKANIFCTSCPNQRNCSVYED